MFSTHQNQPARHCTRRSMLGGTVAPIVIAVALAVAATGCGGDPSFESIEGIGTNQGGITVKPPDVLEGDTIVEDGVDPTALDPAPAPDGTASSDGGADVGAGADTGTDADGTGPNGLPLAPDTAFTWFDGSSGSIASLVGTPTVVNFWASTCPPCVAEMPEFEEVFQEAGDRIAFVGVNVGDRRDAAQRLADETGVTYPLIDDARSQVFRSFSGFVMPTTVLLTEYGEIAYSWAGVLTADQLRILIDEHLAPGTFTDV